MTPDRSHKVVKTARVGQISETGYERTNAAVWTAFVMLLGSCVALIALWLMQPQTARAARPDTTIIIDANPTQIVSELKPIVVQTPTDEINDRLDEVRNLQNLIEVVDTPALLNLVTASSAGSEGVPQKSDTLEGTGKSIAGSRRTRQTWLFDISLVLNKDEYREFLTSHGIQLAAVFADGRIVYLENLDNRPSSITGSSADETRFYTQWSGGNLLRFDRQWFVDAGVDISSAQLVQFFPPELEQALSTLEATAKLQAVANQHTAPNWRTWFTLKQSPDGFEFHVGR